MKFHLPPYQWLSFIISHRHKK